MNARILPPIVLLSLATSCKGERAAGDGMVAIPAATFEMGCDPARDPGCSPTELPRHPVHVGAFWIDRTEVTQASFSGCIGSGGCTPPRGDFDPGRYPRRPVGNVTWEQARAYCAWRGRRLPTEAEWELAARGTDGRVYPWGDEPPSCDKAHTNACGAGPRDVAERPAGRSPFGVHDMAGNVDEWVEDLFRPYGRPGTNHRPAERVARGGAYDAWHSRSTARSALMADHRDHLLGFRCALSR